MCAVPLFASNLALLACIFTCYRRIAKLTNLIPLLVVDCFLHPAKTFESSIILIQSKTVLVNKIIRILKQVSIHHKLEDTDDTNKLPRDA